MMDQLDQAIIRLKNMCFVNLLEWTVTLMDYGMVQYIRCVQCMAQPIQSGVRLDKIHEKVEPFFESGYRSDCPVHRPPPSVCSVHSASVHTAILNEEDVVVVPAEPPPEPEAPHEPPHEAPPEAPQYEEPLRPPTPAPELVQRVIEPEPPEQSPLHGSRCDLGSTHGDATNCCGFIGVQVLGGDPPQDTAAVAVAVAAVPLVEGHLCVAHSIQFEQAADALLRRTRQEY
ncbi:hypothetical protein OSTOST_12340, partial [Ostertagia ostertagi]